MVLFYPNLYGFDIWKWRRVEIAASLLRILKITLKAYIIEKKNHLVATIYWHKLKDMHLFSAYTENLFQG